MNITRLANPNELRRTIEQSTESQRAIVKEIIDHVRRNGDQALAYYTNQFDNVSLTTFYVSKQEIEQAYEKVGEEVVQLIREVKKRIQRFHEHQRKTSWITTDETGTMLGQKLTPLQAVGVYVPGGTASYPSSVLMNVIPAKVAGVKRIVMVTPPTRMGELPPAVLVAANEAGVTEIYKVGGAQAIAALAYGTETIAPVDKIVGPGNIYVALAKREVFGQVDIDMIAGPSEIAILADDTADAKEVAADLLSQAEHDERAASILVTPSESLALKVQQEIEKQLPELPRQHIARASLANNGRIVLVASLEEGIEAINQFAPEHLEIIVENEMEVLANIQHAGAIFLGRWSSEPVGDYLAGPNHVLPTNGTARFSSPLNVNDFIKISSIIRYSQQALEEQASKIAAFARLEGLEAHARAVEIRMEKRGDQ
jgi:histidinol dehydrogenase